MPRRQDAGLGDPPLEERRVKSDSYVTHVDAMWPVVPEFANSEASINAVSKHDS